MEKDNMKNPATQVRHLSPRREESNEDRHNRLMREKKEEIEYHVIALVISVITSFIVTVILTLHGIQ